MQEIESYFTIARVLHDAGITHMVTGSVGAMLYGEPRVTNDIDVVVDLAIQDIPRIVEAFRPPRYYCPPRDIIEVEVRRAVRGHFNIIDQETGFKADVYPVGDDAFMRWAFQHVHPVLVEDVRLPIAPPEYIIVRKLEYLREGGSNKHLRDIRSMLSISHNGIDLGKIIHEVTIRGLLDVWTLVSSR